MVQKSIKGSQELAKAIKSRRNALNLTIEEAASKAGIGTKTWSRYESGESIRTDKYRGVCRALNWHELPRSDKDNSEMTFDINEYQNDEAWSTYLEKNFGKYAAVSFVIGSDILLDAIQEDIQEISSKPRGTHVGELGASRMEMGLPTQFLMRYDYDFLFILLKAVEKFRLHAQSGAQIIAHSVLEELTLYLILEESKFLMECIEEEEDLENDEEFECWDDWVFDIFGDADIETFLYDDIMYLVEGDSYHFDNWLVNQFYSSK